MTKVAVVGLGNILMGDDGAGVRVIESLERLGSLPGNVSLVRGETAGIAILPHVEEADLVILIDSVRFGGKYGEVRVFRDEEIQTDRAPAVSMHDVGAKDLVSILRLASSHLPRLLLVGIEPKNVSSSVLLSPEVESGLKGAVKIVLAEIGGEEVKEK